MPNSILPQDRDGEELYSAISFFFQIFNVGNLLRKCNALKEKGVPVLDIFKYKLCNVFSDRSMYMQQKAGSFREAFSKNTFYRFLNNPKTNWLRFTSLLSRKVADAIEPLTDENRVNAFVVDDSLFNRTSCKKTELGSKVFDHISMKYRKGYRLLTVGWTDGNTFLPVNSSLLASSKGSNLIGPAKHCDGRSLAAKRRKLAQMKGTDVMIELLRKVKAGRLSPGVMITDFTVKALGGKQDIDLPEKTKKFYNTVGDYPDVVAAYLVKEMLSNTKNNAHIEWLTGSKIAWRFMTAGIRKRDFFGETGKGEKQ